MNRSPETVSSLPSTPEFEIAALEMAALIGKPVEEIRALMTKDLNESAKKMQSGVLDVA